jgi:hypothetical protein
MPINITPSAANSKLPASHNIDFWNFVNIVLHLAFVLNFKDLRSLMCIPYHESEKKSTGKRMFAVLGNLKTEKEIKSV